MPRRWYQEKISAGAISDKDLMEAWSSAPVDLRPADLAALKAAAASDAPKPDALPTIADLAAKISGVDWPGLIAERFGAWAAGYFDEGQALWAAPRGKGAYAAWRAVATHDLTPEIAGLPGFALHVSEAPESAIAAIARAADRLGLGEAAMETCFHRMLMTLGGWAQYARYKLWQAELAGGSDQTITDFLAIRLVWEEALFLRYGAEIADAVGERARSACRADRGDARPRNRRNPSGGGGAFRPAGAGDDARGGDRADDPSIARCCRLLSVSTCVRRCSGARSST